MATALAVLAAVFAMLITGCASPGTPPGEADATASAATTSAPSGAQGATPSPPLSVVVFGDSNSTGFSGTLDAGMASGAAWPAHLSPEGLLAGGWAVDGATTSDMASAASPFPGAEVLIIMGGTNDLALGVPPEKITANLVAIADAVGARAVIVAAIPPLDPLPGEATDLNGLLARFAQDRGWGFVDPWICSRTADGTWREMYRTDGVHTSPEGYAQAGARIAAELAAAVPQSR